jgi:glucosyl-3-phosphoglycerate synthase
MGDFHQTGVISTLPRFPAANLERLEVDLERISRTKPITLVLPSLISELDRPALGRIVTELKEVRYLHQIIVSLDKADGDGFWRLASGRQDHLERRRPDPKALPPA